MIDSPARLVAHLRSRFTLSGAGPGHVEMWWKFRIDGELLIQYQSVHGERVGTDLYIVVASTLHCDRVDEPRLEVGKLLCVAGKAVLAQPMIAPTHDEAHVERVMHAVAEQAAVIARARRRAKRPAAALRSA
jgi:hypothetical protein